MKNNSISNRKNIKWITVVGAQEHNLKNINVSIPKEQFTVITGPSGSGKSSLALDVLYSEGKRRYMESLSSYARQFLGNISKPAVERIDGLCPAIAIEQKTVGHNPRSTVGTITEIYDYLRVLFARVGNCYCPECGKIISAEPSEKIIALIMKKFDGVTVTVVAPIVKDKKGEFKNELLQWYRQGYVRFIIDGVIHRFSSEDEIKKVKLVKTYRHTIDLVLDCVAINVDEKIRVAEGVEKALKHTSGTCGIIVGEQKYFYSSNRICLDCSISFSELEPRFFSFNSPIGACGECNGLGTVHYWDFADTESFFDILNFSKTCSSCNGSRLNRYALSVKLGNKNIIQLCDMPIREVIAFFADLTLDAFKAEIAASLLREIKNRLQFLFDVGLYYLSLNRSAETLSGGEGQRIRLATQIGSALSGVLYVLDEPSIGLHQRDNDRLIKTLQSLRDQGNTVVVVEHDLDTIRSADYVIDMGPNAGVNGGRITAIGSPTDIQKNAYSLTGKYLSGKKNILVPKKRRTPSTFLTLVHAKKHNLKDISVSFPLGVLCGISGVSGSGKSTLVMEELLPALSGILQGKRVFTKSSCTIKKGLGDLKAFVIIDQTPIGKTPRSNPATYLGIFNNIRKLFTQLPESNARGYNIGRFSFNVSEGRCDECRGDGSVVISMQFLPDVVVICKVCQGSRYNKETLEIRYKGKTIADILDMSVYEARDFFATHAQIEKRLQLLCEVGLDYLKLGQPATTLSGGEAQRIKLVNELAKRGSNTLYVLDEPTTGLHNSDINKLLDVLNNLVDKGNSMILIEHNLDVLKTVDYIIDLGPEGGDAGGTIVAQGTPEEIINSSQSYTAAYLKSYLI